MNYITIKEMFDNLQLTEDESTNYESIYQIIDKIDIKNEGRNYLPIFFDFLEKNYNYDIGSPGPMVHIIEEIGGYEKYLFESIKKRPTKSTIMLLNRLFNYIKQIMLDLKSINDLDERIKKHLSIYDW